MKKSIFFTAFVLATLSIASCVNELEEVEVEVEQAPDEIQGVYMTFDASPAEDVITKTNLVNEDGVYKFPWTVGDAISLFYGSGTNGGSKFTSNATEQTYTTKFSGIIDVITGGEEDSTDDISFWAIYPYDENNSCDGSSLTFTLASEQTAVAEGISPNTCPTIAKASGLHLGFYQTCGYFRFTVSQPGIKQVIFTNASGAPIAGTMTCSFGDDGKPVLDNITGSDRITVNAPNNGTFATGTNYYVIMAPVTMSNGMYVTYVKDDTQATYTISSQVPIKRKVGNRLENRDANLDWELRDYCLTFSMESGSNSVSLTNIGGNEPSLEFSFDKIIWRKWNYQDILFRAGHPVYIRGENTYGFSQSEEQYSTFVFDNPGASVDGSVMSLLTYQNIQDAVDIEYCFYSLFEGAPIVKAPELPATSLSDNCYEYMFYECTSLEEAPELPSEDLYYMCYAYMFSGCTSLVKAPVLPAEEITLDCYHCMFENCTNLNYVEAYFTKWTVDCDSWTDCTGGWLDGVAETGTFIMSEDATWEIVRGPSGVPVGWTFGMALPDYLCFTAEEANSTISMKKSTDATWELPNLEYSYDGARWTAFEIGTTSVILAEIGDKVYFRGDNERINSSKTNYVSFDISGEVSASGNVLSLLSKTLEETTLKTYVFYGLFKDCTGLISAPELPSNTTAPTYGYASMFEGCSGLKTAPALPATTANPSCYQSMFKNSGITSAPALPATSLSSDCYASMFEGCASLTTATTLAATTLAPGCYQSMFKNSALYSAPALPATSLANNCYASMFEECGSLYTTPLLRATTLAEGCYKSMFKGAIGIHSFPSLPATTLCARCYEYMFANTGFHMNGPDLPATNLSNYCYHGMFMNSNLVHAPLLPAKTLVEGCYAEMFSGCDIVDITVNFTDWNEEVGATTDWLAGPHLRTDSFYGPDDLERDNTDASHIPSSFFYNAPKRFLTFTTDGSNINRMTFNLVNTKYQSFEYSRDMIHWTPWTNTAEYLAFSAEQPLYLRGTNISPSTLGTFRFQGTEPVHVTGNIMHLLSHDESLLIINETATGAGVFKNLFKDCTQLVQAPRLPATKLSWNCYEGMFEGCTSLTLAPELPATTLVQYCYKDMFKGCTSLVGLEIPNQGNYDVSEALDDMILATDISNASYCFESMFEGCTSLTRTPLLHSKRLASNCYRRMFYGCSSLSRVYAAFEYFYLGENGRVSTGFIDDWLYGVSSSGTFYHDRWYDVPADFESTFPRSAGSIPSNWTLAEYTWWN